MKFTGKKMKHLFKKTKNEIHKLVSLEFDEEFYQSNYDYIDTTLKPLEHFLAEGWKESKDPCGWFSVGNYLKENLDVQASGVNPFYHYLKYGKKEGRVLQSAIVTQQTNQEDIPRLVEQADTLEERKLQGRKYYKEVKKILNPKIEFDDSKWQSWLKTVPQSTHPHRKNKAYIEVAAATPRGKNGIIAGWAVYQPDSIVWVENAKGKPHFFDNAYRIFRQDVFDTFYEDMVEALPQTGFILRVKDVNSGEALYVKALSADGIHTISSIEIKPLESDPKNLAAWLFTVNSPFSELSSRFTSVDWPIIEEMLTEKKDSTKHIPVAVTTYGEEVQDRKLVSVIIPLYGRIDFIESQMIEFAQDPYIKSDVEIVYVIDDPNLVEPLKTLSTNLYNLYKIPFKTVWGGTNRGFSGANNLGAERSNGEHLVFMNSDVFPISSGWVEALVKVLEENADVGVVAPRLLFIDGSIQHGGIEFKKRSDLGVWINHHPNMGLDPSLDPYKELTLLPAVTGACMALRRKDFDAIEGWDTGYLIGDFEDTDLCLKLHKEGKKSAYLPTVELTHLERQSFGLTGSEDFRTKVVILNATRHQNRWNELITELSTKEKI